MRNVYALFVSRTIRELKHHRRRIVIFVWAMHGKIAKQMYPKILYHAPIVDVRAIHHAYNSHQTWSYPWNAIDGNVSNVNSVPFAVLQIMMINCCSAMIVIEGMHFTNISYPYLPFYVCSSVVKLKIVDFVLQVSHVLLVTAIDNTTRRPLEL